MKTKILLISAIVLGLGISTTNAQIKPREQSQHQRIKQGVKSGELTKAETKNLREDHKELHKDVKMAKADGKVTKQERKIIKKEQKKNSHKIFKKKHNKRERK
ncbi:MAG: hypothetical protein ABIR03_13530 [Ginsengibacter sp.]